MCRLENRLRNNIILYLSKLFKSEVNTSVAETILKTIKLCTRAKPGYMPVKT